VLRTLLERNLVAIVGRAATPGRPLLYGTTKDFLKHFGLNDLSELPKPREINELLAEAEYEVEKRLLKEMEAKQLAEDGEPTGSDEVTESSDPGEQS
jgi:segregation and condensation protein B